MADQTTRGFRKFMLDPKTSVMSYIADNIPQDRLNNGRPQNGTTTAQQPSVQDPTGLPQNQILGQKPQHQVQFQDGFMRPPMSSRPSQSNSPSSSPRPDYAQPLQNAQMALNSPYIASNVPPANQGQNGYPGAQSQLHSSQTMSNLSIASENISHPLPQSQYPSTQNVNPPTAKIELGPPQPGTRRRTPPQSAPRLYHRMARDFEMTKQSFFLAKSQRNNQEMISLAYTLEYSSRQIWALRHEHSWEFDGYSDASQQIVLSHWRAEYEMWADTVLDIQDWQILVDAANAAYGNASKPGNGEDRDEPWREEPLGFQGPNGEIRDQGSWMQHPMAPQQQPSSPPQQTPSQQQHFLPQQQVPQPHQSPLIQSLSMSSTSTPPPQSSQSPQTTQTAHAQPSLPQTAPLLRPLPYNPHLINPQHPQTTTTPQRRFSHQISLISSCSWLRTTTCAPASKIPT